MQPCQNPHGIRRELTDRNPLVSGIQHKHLVKFLVCSIEGPENLLVYEYVPNNSLDQFLFDKSNGHFLNWKKRFDIIVGTAEEIAYLHEGCDVRIIHRDIKGSNVLLDENLSASYLWMGCIKDGHVDFAFLWLSFNCSGIHTTKFIIRIPFELCLKKGLFDRHVLKSTEPPPDRVYELVRMIILAWEVFMESTLIPMCWEFEMLNDAKVFKQMSSTNMISWNSVATCLMAIANDLKSLGKSHLLLILVLHIVEYTLLLKCLGSQDEKIIAPSNSPWIPAGYLKLVQSLMSLSESKTTMLAGILELFHIWVDDLNGQSGLTGLEIYKNKDSHKEEFKDLVSRMVNHLVQEMVRRVFSFSLGQFTLLAAPNSTDLQLEVLIGDVVTAIVASIDTTIMVGEGMECHDHTHVGVRRAAVIRGAIVNLYSQRNALELATWSMGNFRHFRYIIRLGNLQAISCIFKRLGNFMRILDMSHDMVASEGCVKEMKKITKGTNDPFLAPTQPNHGGSLVLSLLVSGVDDTKLIVNVTLSEVFAASIMCGFDENTINNKHKALKRLRKSCRKVNCTFSSFIVAYFPNDMVAVGNHTIALEYVMEMYMLYKLVEHKTSLHDCMDSQLENMKASMARNGWLPLCDANKISAEVLFTEVVLKLKDTQPSAIVEIHAPAFVLSDIYHVPNHMGVHVLEVMQRVLYMILVIGSCMKKRCEEKGGCCLTDDRNNYHQRQDLALKGENSKDSSSLRASLMGI